MSRPSPRQRLRTVLVLPSAAMMMIAGGCVDTAEPTTDGAPDETLRLGRVHVLADAGSSREDERAPLAISARFAFVRGLDEEFARARVDVPTLATDLLDPGQCATPEALWGDLSESADDGGVREVVLVDAGEISVVLGDHRIALPLALVPDLLPYMSGIEYVYRGTGELEVEGATPVVVEAQGSELEEMPSFAIRDTLPPALDLSLQPSDDPERQVPPPILEWEPGPSEEVVFTLTAVRGDELVGTPTICVFDDRGGEARLDLAYLRTLGLPASAEGLRIDASRANVTAFSVGEISASELVLEHRSRFELAL